MKPIKFKGSNLTLAENQPQYQQLPVCYQGGTEATMTSCWKLSWKERIRLLFKGKLFISQLTFHSPLQPILPETIWKEPKCVNCGKEMGAHAKPSFYCPQNLN